jgi:hypothetical protein
LKNKFGFPIRLEVELPVYAVAKNLLVFIKTYCPGIVNILHPAEKTKKKNLTKSGITLSRLIKKTEI